MDPLVPCDRELFITKNEADMENDYDDLPAGVESVAKYCQTNIDDKIIAAQCCINVGRETKCNRNFNTEKCADENDRDDLESQQTLTRNLLMFPHNLLNI